MPDPQLSELGARIRAWGPDPVRFVRECLFAEPDAWQIDALNAANGPGVKRLCMKACTGPGKSTVLAWLAWWWMATKADALEFPKGYALSVTEDNLKTGLWPELAKWQQRSKLLQQFFGWQSERIFNKQFPERWFIAARSFPKSANPQDQGNVLSGLHAKYPLVLIDESGDISPAVGRAAEQAMDPCERGLIAQAGNPTSQTGLLYDSSIRNRKIWDVITITADPDDPKRTPRRNAEEVRKLIDQYGGRENPWVQSKILGIFPSTAMNALLSASEVEAAIGKHYREDQYQHQAKVLGIDCARFGDDRTVIFKRQGLVTFPPTVLRGARSEQIAGNIATIVRDWQPDAIFIDGSGGYGAGTVDALRLAHITAQEVHGSGSPIDQRYFNKRAECWWCMAEWIKAGGALPPNIPEIVAELTEPTYWLHRDKFQIEEKEAIKKRLQGKSPDLADALALTFTQPVMPARRPDHRGLWYQPPKQSSDFDPFRPES